MKYFIFTLLFALQVLGQNTRVLPRGISIPSGSVLVGGASNIGTTTPVGTSGQFLQSSGTGTPVWKNIQGGLKNYITNGDAESSTTGWATYSDSAGVAPVDGTGGTANVTWTTSSTAPLELTNSFIFTKDAANRQGNGVSYAFTIDREDQAKVMNITASYLVNSGTFTAGTSSDLTVWIYDVTNATLIQPSSYTFLSNGTSVADKFSATFQTASNSTSYRLIFHVSTTSASAYSLKFDSIKTGPSNYTYGTPITAWQSYSPAWTGSGGTPSLGNGTLNGRWRRVGQNAEIQIYLAFGSTTTHNNATVWLFSYPSGIALDTTATADGGSSPQGTGLIVDSGTAFFTPITLAVPAGIRHYVNNTSNAIGYQIPMTWTNGDSLTSMISLPVLGWSASTQMSDQTDSRSVVFYGTATGVAATANVTDIPFTTVTDRLGGWDGSTYTVKVGGDHFVNTFFYGPSTCTVYAFVDGVQFNSIGVSVGGQGGGGGILIPNLRIGQTISIRTNSSQTFSASIRMSTQIFRLAAPQTISAADSVNVVYGSVLGSAIGTSNSIQSFGSKESDSHGNWTSNNTFTAQISGLYQVSVAILTNALTLTTSQAVTTYVYKNGSQYRIIGFAIGNGATSIGYYVSGAPDFIRLNAGDTLQIYASSSVATAQTTSGGYNKISIIRVGN